MTKECSVGLIKLLNVLLTNALKAEMCDPELHRFISQEQAMVTLDWPRETIGACVQ